MDIWDWRRNLFHASTDKVGFYSPIGILLLDPQTTENEERIYM